MYAGWSEPLPVADTTLEISCHGSLLFCAKEMIRVLLEELVSSSVHLSVHLSICLSFNLSYIFCVWSNDMSSVSRFFFSKFPFIIYAFNTSINLSD